MSNFPLTQDVSNRLKLFMKKISANGKDMAKMGCITEQAYSGYLKEKNLPSANALMQWAKNAGMNVNWLLTGEGSILREEKALTPAETEGHDSLKRDYAETLEELNALKSKVIDLQEELLAMHRGRRQERRNYGAVPSNVPGGGSAAPLSHPGNKN